ncbi:MAG: zinc ABC transporter solute-binding protein [Candidatus Marinimicrobia bacterium]|jgi:zinc transport system substrate-binding protein|nr:zinc ABC transporter solute-binding protein [Candidatus Neomarinimicrobiota bacterium]
MKTGFCFILILPLLYITQLMAASDIKVLVSIKPFHSLVSAIMQDVSEPLLLINGNNSPHSYALRPSSAENLQQADLVFWGGEILEGFLTKPLQSLASRAKLVSLQETAGLRLLPLRSGIGWQKHETDSANDHSAEDETTSTSGTDPHIWLDPYNAKIISSKIVEILTEMDPQNAQSYRRNGEKYGLRLELLDRKLKAEMTKVAETPYMVFHDAYQYFEKRYQLNVVGSMTLHIGFGSSVRRLTAVRKTIQKEKIRCIFSEPQFSPKLLQTVIAGTNVKQGTLDPLGAGLESGAELYFTLLNNLSHNLSSCLN